MRRVYTSILFIPVLTFCILLFNNNKIEANCNNCSTMVCDGVNCDDGSSGDGVQTSKNCSCGNAISGACAYVYMDLTGSPYYDPNDPLTKLIIFTQESGNFSIYYTDTNCTISDCASPDFVVSSGQAVDNLPGAQFSMIVCKNGGNAGRRDFSFSVSSSTIENCVNTVDDTQNGLVDCDDPSCSTDTSCDFTSSSSGDDSGMESNNRLGQLIAKRNYNRTISQRKNVYSIENKVTTQTLQNRNETDLDFFIPIDPFSHSSTYLSSPTDLIGITNAKEVMSVDYYIQDEVKAAILAIKTDEEVYEHTKYICDRLDGTSIENIWNYAIDDEHAFIVTKYQHLNGIKEYSTTFSIYKNENENYTLENHWNLESYPKDKSYINFQIWASNMQQLKELTLEVLEKIEDDKIIDQYHISDKPSVYIKNLEYKENSLYLNIINHDNINNLELNGDAFLTELSDAVQVNYNISLSGEKEESIIVDTESFYAMGLTVSYDNINVHDVIYFADGVWDIDYNANQTDIYNYQIFPNLTSTNENEYLIERNILVEGMFENDISIFRSLDARFNANNLSKYNQLQFTAEGNGSLEVILVKESIENWENHPRTVVSLSENTQTFQLNIHDFITNENEEWDDIEMIVFKLYNDKAGEQNIFRLSINDLMFKNANLSQELGILGEEISIHPNPFRDNAQIQFNTLAELNYTLEIFNAEGKQILLQNNRSIRGNNIVEIHNDNYTHGIYFIKIELENGEFLYQKLIIIE